MRIKLILLALVCLAMSCSSNNAVTGNGDIPYVEAMNYFLRNDVKAAPPAVIDSQNEFDKYFGMAAVMGKNGMPTTIDFAKQYVIAVTVPETRRSTNIEPVKLCYNGDGKVEFSYKITQKEDLQYTISPLLLLIVDKSYGSDVVLKCE